MHNNYVALIWSSTEIILFAEIQWANGNFKDETILLSFLQNSFEMAMAILTLEGLKISIHILHTNIAKQFFFAYPL